MSDASVSRAEYANRPVSRGYCEVMLHDSSEIVQRLARSHLELLAEVEGLRRDKERLDWLSNNRAMYIEAEETDKRFRWVVCGIGSEDLGSGYNPREAIDAAMLPDPPEAKDAATKGGRE